MPRARGLASHSRISPDSPAPADRPVSAGRGWRDPWAWAVLLAVVPLIVKCAGAPLGEPVAEDFDFLRRALLTGDRSLLDGGGSESFWRPLAHQIYYLAFGRMIVDSPRTVAAMHFALLALGAVLLYRAFRRSFPGHAAAAIASFPLLAESTRTIVAWPTQFVDLGLFLFSALAIHERAARRLWTALPALLAALFCKEFAVVTGLLLPWWPARDASRRERLLWAIATGALMLAWGLVYLWVRSHAGLTLPHQIETDPAIRATPATARFAWAIGNSLRAVFSLALFPGRWDLVAMLGSAAALGTALFVCASTPEASRRARRALPWLVWGFAWFVLSSAALAAIFPLWQPNRSQFGSVGLGVGAVALLDAAAPLLVAALVGTRVLMLLLAPNAPATVAREAPDRGAFMDFERLSRLQRLMVEIRTTLRSRYPRLPHGASVSQHYLPLRAEYALGGGNGLQVWYRDTTLRWVRFSAMATSESEPVTLVEFEPYHRPQVTLIQPGAMVHLIAAQIYAHDRRYPEAYTATLRADSALSDSNAVVFRGTSAATRAVALIFMDRKPEARREAQRSLRLFPFSPDGRFVAGMFAMADGKFEEAEGHFDTLLMERPDDSLGVAMRDRARLALRRGTP